MGTPEFAQAILRPLCESSHQILAVVTGPDKPAGRRQKLTPTPVRVEAERLGLPVLTPGSLKDDALFGDLRALNADLFVVAAFRVLPPRLVGLPRLGSINIHTSLLPKYRGAAPIHWAIINGESETGLTSFFLRETIDTGDIILQQRMAITGHDTYDTLHDRLAAMAGPFLLRTLELVERGERQPEPQDESRVTRAPKIHSLDAMIDFGMPADRVRNFVRGMATRPGAYSYFRGEKIKIHECATVLAEVQAGTRPGTILPDRKRLLIICGAVSGQPTVVEITKVVPAGKCEMDGLSFRNGYRPLPGEVLGEIREGVQEKQ